MEVGRSPLSPAPRISVAASGYGGSLGIHMNERVEGRVLRSFSSGDVLLLINGKQTLARSHVPLKAGDRLLLRVERVSPVSILRIETLDGKNPRAPDVSRILAAVKGNLWKTVCDRLDREELPLADTERFRGMAAGARETFSRSGDALKRVIERSGFCWEGKLRQAVLEGNTGEDHLRRLVEGDVKGLLSRLHAAGGEKNRLLGRLMDTIRDIQVLNFQGLKQDHRIFLPMPLQFPDGFFPVGELLVHLPVDEETGYGEKGDTKREYRIVFLLELSGLGPLRVDLSVRGRQVGASFLLAGERAGRRVKRNLRTFADRLRERGFSIRYMECRLRDPAEVSRSLAEEMRREAGGIRLVV